MAQTITVEALNALTAKHAVPTLVDVRSATEYSTGHLPGSINIPLDELESRSGDLASKSDLVLICKSGRRARMAACLLPVDDRAIHVLEGGTDAWHKAGLPLVLSTRTRWSLERQVRFVAGALVLSGAVLSMVFSPLWLAMCVFVGAGLIFASVSDLCPMGVLLCRMPWNRVRRVTHTEAATTEACCR